MSTFLFDSIIFGPVWSRRLGESLGINLLPVNRKICNFNCIYCECGLTPNEREPSGFAAREEVNRLLKLQLQAMIENNAYLDAITFAGNGEPTMHPDFPGIMNDTILLRDQVLPKVKIAVLSNATLAADPKISNALMKADLNILKLDSAMDHTLRVINCPRIKIKASAIVDSLKRFRGKLIIQTLFLRGKYNDNLVDNTTDEEIKAWLTALGKIKPERVMIYTIARETPISGIEMITKDELLSIARRVEEIGIQTQVSG